MKPLILGVMALLAVAACGPTVPAATSTQQPTSATSTTPAKDAAIEVGATFDLYVEAVNSKNSDHAMGLTASTAFTQIEEFRKHALSSTEARIAALPSGHRLTVYGLRAAVDPAVLRSGTGRGVMLFMIEHGLINVNTTSKVVRTDGSTTVNQTKPQLTKVSVTGDRATGELASNDPNAPTSSNAMEFVFLRESGLWKVDPGPMFDFMTVALEQVAAKKGVTVDQVITESLVAQFGAARAAGLRQPLDG